MTYDYRKFNYDNDNYMIFRTIKTYSRTASGKNWKSKPDEVENSIITSNMYTNYVTAIPFFNNFGEGAYCRAKWSYNENGYLPTTITSVSPYKETKKVAEFFFIKKDKMLMNAGWREKEVVKNAKSFEYVDDKMIELFTDDNGVIASGIYDTFTNQWRD